MSNLNREHGFTITELTIAMLFISFLLLTIAMTTIQISKMYNEGVTTVEVNASGREIADDFQRTLSDVTPFDPTPSTNFDPSGARKYIIQSGGGRFCTGRYTYVWNMADKIYQARQNLTANYGSLANRYAGVFSPKDDDVIRLIRVFDSGGKLCQNNDDIKKEDAKELIGGGSGDIGLLDFRVDGVGDNSLLSQKLYKISYVVGTADRLDSSDQNYNTLVKEAASAETDNLAQFSCKPDSSEGANPQFCSVNRFSVLVRAGNDLN